MRTYHKPAGEEAGEDQLQGMEEVINGHLERMFFQGAKRNILDFGVGRTTLKANIQDTRLDSQKRDCDAGAMFHAGRALEIALHLVYARGTNRIMRREYPGITKDDLNNDRKIGHSLRPVYDRIISDLDGRDIKNALNISYQKILNQGITDIFLDDKKTSIITPENIPLSEARIDGMSDGVEYTSDHVDFKDMLLSLETTPSIFSQMPYETFEEFLDKADASYYTSDVSDNRRDMRWADYYFRDHEYGRQYTVVGIKFFARLVKEIVNLSNQQWTWDTRLLERWLRRSQENNIKNMEILAMQNLEPDTAFAKPLSMVKIMEMHKKMGKEDMEWIARNVNADFVGLHRRKLSYYTKNQDDLSTLMNVTAPPSDTVIFGFDSAWAGKKPGAICAISFDENGHTTFNSPELVSFEEALRYIKENRPSFARAVVAIDQPTIVPNLSGMRPVEQLAGSVLSYTGGGVQPASQYGHGKMQMFGPEAPIWCFKRELGAEDDPDAARDKDRGLFLMEVFPALALPGLHAKFSGRNSAPKYNPENHSKFRTSDWNAVVEAVIRTARQLKLASCADWCKEYLAISDPRKRNQDQLDSVICALIGYVWLACDRSHSMLLGDLKTGYIVTPVSHETSNRLHAASSAKGIPCV